MDESFGAVQGETEFQAIHQSQDIKVWYKTVSASVLLMEFFLDFLVYHGNMSTQLNEMGQHSLLTERIPTTLMQKYLKKATIYSLITTILHLALANHLLENGTHITGTIRDNRKHFPNELKAVQLGKGEAAYYQSDGIVIAKFRAHKDKAVGKSKILHILSTAHGAEMGNTSKRDRDGNIIQKPRSIISYNHNMGGIDLMDHQLEGLDVLRKSYKWYKKLFLRLVLQCALSSHKLYRLQGGKSVFLHFLLEIITQLLANSPRLERPLKGKDVYNIARLTGRNHWPAK